jgi:hypothetical protein
MGHGAESRGRRAKSKEYKIESEVSRKINKKKNSLM